MEWRRGAGIKALPGGASRVGICMRPINYPTVAKGTEPLRITPSPYHEDALIDQLAEALLQVWEQLGLPLKKKSRAAE